MKRRLIYIIAIMSLACISMLLFACSNEEDTIPEDKTVYTVRYEAEIGGSLYYFDKEGVNHDRYAFRFAVSSGGAVPEITAYAGYGYFFNGWSDGVKTATRHDTDIASDTEVWAQFVQEEYTVQYIAGEHGKIEGIKNQTIFHGEAGETVTAVPDEGYEFIKWSDGVTTAERTDYNVKDDIEVTAEFALIVREYAINYRTTLTSEIDKPTLKLTYGELDGVTLPVPEKEHFIFQGWYYGEQQVADKDGNLLIDDEFLKNPLQKDMYGRDLDITAKWMAEETFPFKILIVYVTRIQARLYDRYGIYHDIDFTMTELQRKFCEESTKLLKQTMDEMCDYLVDFQIDEYFTTQTVTTEQFSQQIDSISIYTLLDPSSIPEIQGMTDGYDNVISVFGFGGDNPDSETAHLFNYAAGVAARGESSVFLDVMIYSATGNGYELADVLNGQNKNHWIISLETFVHETAHTIDLRMHLFSFHKANNIAIIHDLDVYTDYRLYYLYSMEYEGRRVGIPYEFWKGDIAQVNYEVSVGDGGYSGGGTIDLDKSDSENLDLSVAGYSRQEVAYGQDAVGVKAEPLSGYKFVRWSDGVTTPGRKDKNIAADFTVTAIFEPIVYTVTITASEGGGLRVGASQDVQKEITIQAKFQVRTESVYPVAQEGYRFVGWSDGTPYNQWSAFIQFPDLHLFDENLNYKLTAIFEKIE